MLMTKNGKRQTEKTEETEKMAAPLYSVIFRFNPFCGPDGQIGGTERIIK